MTWLDKFEDLNRWFISSGTEMTQWNKFEDLNDRFTSLGTEMTHPNKFRDRWHTLLFPKYIFSYIKTFSLRSYPKHTYGTYQFTTNTVIVQELDQLFRMSYKLNLPMQIFPKRFWEIYPWLLLPLFLFTCRIRYLLSQIWPTLTKVIEK